MYLVVLNMGRTNYIGGIKYLEDEVYGWNELHYGKHGIYVTMNYMERMIYIGRAKCMSLRRII